MSQQPPISMTLIAETKGEPGALAAPIRQVVRGLAPNLPVYGVRSFHDLYDQRSVQVANIMLVVLGSLATIGFGLALVGLYAVVAYQVMRRTREIGIRMAIGASKGEVIRTVLLKALWLAGLGSAVGVALSFAASQGLTAALQVPHFDVMLLAGVVVSLLVVTMGAALIPARRAALIDPMVAMRQD